MINKGKCLRMADAFRRHRAWTYTHHDPVENGPVLREMNDRGFTVNVSCNGVDHLDWVAAKNLGVPLTVALPSTVEAFKAMTTEGGTKIVRCPAEWDKGMTCQRCGKGEPLCYRRDRNYAIGFIAHGTKYKAIDEAIGKFKKGLKVLT